MDKAALWIGYAVMLAGGVGMSALSLWLAAEGVWKAWRSWRGFFNIVEAFEALREKQAAASAKTCSCGQPPGTCSSCSGSRFTVGAAPVDGGQKP